MNAGSASRCTNTRDRAQQSCPALPNTAPANPRAAASRSASANTIDGDLPPSSSVTRFTSRAARAAISRPTAVEPVKATLAMPGCSTIRRPTSSPVPTSTVSRLSGAPAASTMRCNSSAVSGVSSDGLWMTALPAAKDGAIFQLAIVSGKFHGVITPTTPSGSRKVMSTPPATGIVVPPSRCGAPA